MSKKQVGFVAGATVLGLLGAGVAFAAIPNGNVINGCYTKSGGTLRVVDTSTTSCRSGETSIAWNQTGPQGPQGIQGIAGTNGTNGTNGVDGTNGTNGTNGAPGAPGPAGPSDAYIGRMVATSFLGNDISGPGAEVVRLSLPAGVYALFGKAEIRNTDGDSQLADCSLSTGESALIRLGAGQAAADLLSLSVQDLLTLTDPGFAILRCHTYAGRATNAKLTAIKVGALHG